VLSNKLGRVLRHMDTECKAYIESSPDYPLCARTLAKYWLHNQAWDAARGMLLLYLSHAQRRDQQPNARFRSWMPGRSHRVSGSITGGPATFQAE